MILVSTVLLLPGFSMVLEADPSTNGSNGGSDLSEGQTSSRIPEPITFTNVTDDVGLSGVRGDSYAWGDYNNDGYQDLLVKGARLFRNNGPPRWDFTEVTEHAGLDSSGYAVWGDYNNDGYLDFYSAGNPYTGSGENPDGSMDTLWRNNGPPDWTFTNATAEAGNPDDGYPSLAAGWGDYDLDGFIDLYVVNWRDLNDVRYPDVFWHNNGDGTFSDYTVKAGIDDYTEPYAGMGVNWGDYNDDGWPDIYVSNYLLTPNFLWHNNGDGTFVNRAFETGTTGEESRRAGQRYYGHTAGSSFADYDNDGDLDLWQTNLAHKDPLRAGICADSELLRNNGRIEGYTFTNVRDETGIPTQQMGGNEELFFGVAWGDYDNDGDLDLWIPQIKNYIDYAYSYFFRSNGDGTFTDVSEETGVRVWDSDGGAWCDYNNDGWLDLITEGKVPYENGTYEVRLYRNDGAKANDGKAGKWLNVQLKAGASNRAAIGARITVTDGTGRSQMREVEGGTAGHSYQHSLNQEFGFGDYSGTVDISVRWPGGLIEDFQDISLNQFITLKESEVVPDITVSRIRASDPDPVAGDIVTLTATVKNIGTQSVDKCRVQFIEDKFKKGQIGSDQFITNRLGPGAETTVSVEWDTTGMEGTNRIYAAADQVQPPERNTNNNRREMTVTVRGENKLPVPHLQAKPTTVEIPDSIVEFDGSGSADDGEIIAYYFDFGDGETSKWVDIPVISHRYTATGTFTASLIVQDNNEAVSESAATVAITVLGSSEPGPPSIQKIHITPDPGYAGETAAVTVSAFDPDDDIVDYEYTVSAGTLISSGSTASWMLPKEPGDYNIEVTVFDREGNFDRTDRYLMVMPYPVELYENIMISGSITPANIYADGQHSIVLTAKAEGIRHGSEKTTVLGSDEIDSVVADLSMLGGSKTARLVDNGRNGDENAADGIYSMEFTPGSSSSGGTLLVPITVTLEDEREVTTKVSVVVVSAGDTEGSKDDRGLPGFGAEMVLMAVTAVIILNFIKYRRKFKR